MTLTPTTPDRSSGHLPGHSPGHPPAPTSAGRTGAGLTGAGRRPPAAPEMVLIFRLSGEAFALSVSVVHEILDPIPVTRVPNAGGFAPGLVNVRGAVAPLVDVRQRLRMPAAAADAEARLIVLELPVGGAPTRLAILADAVEEVIEADLAALEPIPDLGARWPEHYLKGVARRGDGLVILLNTETLFQPDGPQGADRPAQA